MRVITWFQLFVEVEFILKGIKIHMIATCRTQNNFVASRNTSCRTPFLFDDMLLPIREGTHFCSYFSRFKRNSASASSATALPLKIFSAANALAVSCAAICRDFSNPTIAG